MSEIQEPPNIDPERLELALRASNEGIWDWLTHETTIYYSSSILGFLGLGDAQAPNIFLPPYLSVHQEDRPRFASSMAAALAPGGAETLSSDVRIRNASEGWCWLRIRGTCMRDESGKTVRIAGSMIDISLRKAAEAEVEEERHLLMTLIDHVPLQIYFKDLNSRIVMANKGLAKWQGRESAEELIGMHDSELFSDDHWKKAEADEKRIIESGISMTGQLERETWKDGEETFVVTSKFPWHNRYGEIKGTFGVSSDVTSLVLAQNQATELANELLLKNRSYEEEVQLAREIQQALTASSFVPRESENGNRATFSSRYLPISGLAGDFYEVMDLGEDRYGVFICDVMGHGIRAALIVSMLRGLIATWTEKRRSSSDFLGALNSGLTFILQRANVTMFATAFYGVIDLRSLTLECSCAGHPGPVLSGKKGNIQLCTTSSEKGPALGLIPGANYPKHTVSLQDSDRILLFTDGVLEAENEDGEQFLAARLLKTVGENPSTELESWLDGILETVLDFSEGHHFDDDVCMLGIAITGDGG
ncbi:MAG: SpoIIE family protein phosphatase [Akkermansiaceae bacterium]|nr:SpoIIE family protein phosphatase [Akkermansiaceae bacterium]